MARSECYKFIYVAQLADCVKIGITKNPTQREMQLRRYGSGAFMARVWAHENPSAVELMCRDAWHLRRAHSAEEFVATPRAAVRLVQAMMRRYAQGHRPAIGWRRTKQNAKRLAVRRAAGVDPPSLAESTIRKYWRAEEIAAARSRKKRKTR